MKNLGRVIKYDSNTRKLAKDSNENSDKYYLSLWPLK